MDYFKKLKNKFLEYHKQSNREGRIIRLGFGDDNLVSELRKTDQRYLVSVYKFRNGTFKRLFQERYSTLNQAQIRMKEIQGEF
jgi:hypothetical protein